jgi:hypothetical protein
MDIYSLYVKTHRITGLKYFGQTTQNPLTYPGSGIDWSNHLAIHGNDVDTVVIFSTTDRKEMSEVGRYYSTLWNVVSAMDDFGNKIYANRIPETGGGGGARPGHEPYWNPTEEELLHHGIQIKKRWEDEDYRTRTIQSQKDSWSTERKQEQSIRLSGKKRPEHSAFMKSQPLSPNFKCDVRTDAHKNNIAKSLTGKPKTEEHKKKLGGPKLRCCRLSDRKEISVNHLNRRT